MSHDLHGSFRRIQQTDQRPSQSTLSASGLTDQAVNLSFIYGNINTIDSFYYFFHAAAVSFYREILFDSCSF